MALREAVDEWPSGLTEELFGVPVDDAIVAIEGFTTGIEICDWCSNPALGRVHLSSPWPNPAAGRSARVAFYLPVDAHVTLDLYDLHGRRIAPLLDGAFPDGRHEHGFSTERLGAGVYFLRLESAGARVTRKLQVVR